MDSSSVLDLGAGIQARAILQQSQANSVESLRDASANEAPAVAAKKFESLLATQLVKEMRRSLGDGFFGEGPQADVYSGWLDQFLGEALARDGGLHLADGVRRSLESKQAAADAADAVRLAGADAENPAGEDSPVKSGAQAPMITKAAQGSAAELTKAAHAAMPREETR